MSLSVERLRELRADAYDLGNALVHLENKRDLTEFESVFLAHYIDTAKAYTELIAIKEAEPVAYIVEADNKFLSWDGPIEGGNHRTPLIRKPE